MLVDAEKDVNILFLESQKYNIEVILPPNHLLIKTHIYQVSATTRPHVGSSASAHFF